MKKQQKDLCVDFALLMLAMCEPTMLPNLVSVPDDMSGMEHLTGEAWDREYCHRLNEQNRLTIESHPLGAYFIAKDYSYNQVQDFIIFLQGKQLEEALEILNSDPE